MPVNVSSTDPHMIFFIIIGIIMLIVAVVLGFVVYSIVLATSLETDLSITDITSMSSVDKQRHLNYLLDERHFELIRFNIPLSSAKRGKYQDYFENEFGANDHVDYLIDFKDLYIKTFYSFLDCKVKPRYAFLYANDILQDSDEFIESLLCKVHSHCEVKLPTHYDIKNNSTDDEMQLSVIEIATNVLYKNRQKKLDFDVFASYMEKKCEVYDDKLAERIMTFVKDNLVADYVNGLPYRYQHNYVVGRLTSKDIKIAARLMASEDYDECFIGDPGKRSMICEEPQMGSNYERWYAAIHQARSTYTDETLKVKIMSFLSEHDIPSPFENHWF